MLFSLDDTSLHDAEFRTDQTAAPTSGAPAAGAERSLPPRAPAAPTPAALTASALVAVEAVLAAATTNRVRDVATLIRQVLLGVLPRPVCRGSTQRGMLVQMAGVARHTTYADTDVIAVLDRLVPLLEHLPGREVRLGADGALEIGLSTFAAVQEGLEKHVAGGGQIHRRFGGSDRFSMVHVAEITGRDVREITSCERTACYLAELLGRPGVIGPAFRRKQADPVRRDFYDRTLVWLRKRYDAKLPLPEKPRYRSGVPDHRAIRLAISPDCPNFVGRKEYNDQVALHLADFGVAPEGSRLNGPPTFGNLVLHLQEIWCEENGQASLANLDTAMGRVMSARNLSDASPVPDDLFADVDALIVAAAAVDKPLAASSRRNLGSFVRFAAKHREEALRRADDLPRDPAKALHLAILRSGKTIAELIENSLDPETGTVFCRQHLATLRSTTAALPKKYEPCLLRLETEVFHTGGRIAARFIKRGNLADIVCTPYFRSLSWEMRNLLPEDAHRLTDDELKSLVEERETKVLRQDRMHSKVMSASKEVMGQLPLLPKDAPVLGEIEAFVAYKKCVVPELMRSHRGRWCDATATIGRRQLLNLVRFFAMDRSKGGLGKPVMSVTLADVLNWKVVASYLNWMAGRYAEVEHGGRKRGAWLTSFDLSVVTIVISMLDPVNGFVTQQRAIFQSRLAADEGQLPSYSHLESLRIRMQADTVEEEDVLEREEEFEETFSRAHVDRRVMPPAILAEAAEQWVKACAVSRNRLSNLIHYLTRFIDKGRDPMAAIAVIVKSKDPMSFLREILVRAQADLPNRHLKPHEHAIAVRDVLLFALLCLTGLRSKNLRQLLYEPGGGGHINLVSPEDADGVDALLINIPWQNFKNLGSWYLFGRDGNKMDYQRRLEDWYNVVPLFELYVDVCRPHLIGAFAEKLRGDADPAAVDAGLVRQTTRALFPIPSLQLMDEGDLNRICHTLTSRYHVVDAGGRVKPGRMKFGPHAVRDVLATHIIISSDDEGRWEIAADLLQTSVGMVKERYAKRTIVDRTGRADHYFAAAGGDMPALQVA